MRSIVWSLLVVNCINIYASFYCSRKAFYYGLLKDMADNPAKWKGRKVLFIHTGGLLGLYVKADQLSSLVGSWRRMDLEDSVQHKDGTGKMF
jgi:hypothetical protein